ncbi:40S ribosomal protein mrp2, mitochondrial [Gaertneriomyces sp. JEL0708]|nr:hypothetical protein BC832DRAFT_528320 [Gaertneriomyces semiglobifer]KAJ3189483.1 40S ribosomal protein mrp2, mitochondrial [Gaertneriomyces sp. JEL0708]
MPVASIVRDRLTRLVASQKEPVRQALRSISRDTSLPGHVRMKAMIELHQMPRYTRPTAVHSRCVESGKARGHVTAFKISRIVFREKALAGEIPGVKKSTW